MEKNVLRLDTNAVVMPVVRDGERVGEIVMHPDDTVFLGKFYALLPKLEAQRDALSGTLDADDAGKTLGALQKLWESMRADIDEVFGVGTCDTAFGSVCSLALAQQFFEGVAEVLQGEREDKIAKYTSPAKAVLK
ncbi:MAG: hypothetical protein GXZ14_07110 [Ruminococcaceae bacterium]|jgi:hypothetical protein|nr:hypothetical protein [Oscillospiraceae bacterium]